MKVKVQTLVLAIFLVGLSAQGKSSNPSADNVVFKAKNGGVIVWDKRTGTLRTPHSEIVRLTDCGDEFQTCLTDHRGFAFAFFRNCDEGDYKRLKFYPNIIAVLHNDLWLVFDASPNYMFHYELPKGVVGIYIGPTPAFDFRRLLHDRKLRLDKFDKMEYVVTGLGTMAACKAGEG